jgi:DNA mismatch endonuclease (patch repair protein)
MSGLTTRRSDLLPTPAPSSESVSRRMAMVRTAGTEPELRLRRILHGRGLRYRVNYRPANGPRCRVDIAFPAPRVAVFVDGCFWHGCPSHASWPKSNADWWRAKIEHTRERDRQTMLALEESGWVVIRAWEHDAPEAVAATIERAVVDRRIRVAL